ncbi:MAG TPA: hypothetical protein VK596_01425 [Edaphobacter sp.]|nr:hypothetical protein [Edaphobacter sp.]
MKVARAIIGTEEIRGTLPMSGYATSETSVIPFATSFGESLTAITTKEGEIQEAIPTGSLLAGSKETAKQDTSDVGEDSKAPHRHSGVLSGVPSPSTKILADGGWKQDQTELAHSLQVEAPQGSLKKSIEAPEKNNADEERFDENGLQLPATPQTTKDTKIAGKDSVTVETKPSPAGANSLKEALKMALEQRTSPEAAHAHEESGRSGDGIKVHEGGTQHKASRRESAADATVTASLAQETQVPLESGAPQMAALPTPAITAPQGEAQVASSMSKDSSSSAKATEVLPLAGGKTRETRTARESSSRLSQSSKTEVRTERSSDPVLEKASDPEPGERRASAGPQREESTSAVAPPSPEKPHLSNATQDIVPAAAPAHPQLVTVQPVEKASLSHAYFSNPQEPLGFGASQMYGTDQHKTLMAAPTALEVGVPGGTHGWLRVRAELAGDGAVHASVSSSSTAGTEMLRRELPSLTNYLHQEQVSVSSVVVHVSSSTMDSSNPSGGGGQSHEAGRGAADTHDSAGRENGTVRHGEGIAEEEDGADWTSSTGYAEAGGWLSIRA